MASHLQEIAQSLLFRFVWSVSIHPAHRNVSASQVCVLGLKQVADIGTDKHCVQPVRLSIFCLYGRGYTPQQFIATFTTVHPDRHVLYNIFLPPYLDHRVPREEVRILLGHVKYVSIFLSGTCRFYGSRVEIAVDCAALKGAGNEIIVEELVLAGKNII